LLRALFPPKSMQRFSTVISAVIIYSFVT